MKYYVMLDSNSNIIMVKATEQEPPGSDWLMRGQRVQQIPKMIYSMIMDMGPRPFMSNPNLQLLRSITKLT